MNLLNFFSRKNKGSLKYNPLDKTILKEYDRVRPYGSQKHFCYVPSTSLTFSFKGEVYACSYNRQVLLGRYPENSIKEIWSSTNAVKLRNYLANNDLSFGCGHCKYFLDRKKFSNLKPLNFDRYAKIYKKDYPLVMEFEMSNTCNLECQMCIGEVSSSIRKNRDKLPPILDPYDEHFFKQLEEYIPYLKEAKFYGGEPFLIEHYYKIWDIVKRRNPGLKMFVITNGTVWNNKMREALYGGTFDVAVSIDAMDKSLLEKIRKNVVKETLITNIHHIKDYVSFAGTSMTLSFTLQKENWMEFPKIIEFANSINAHLFISYLETPVEFAITRLNKDDLIHIKEQLSTYSFQNKTRSEKHNYNCFTDFLNFLDFNINTENKNYVEYRYGDNKNHDSKAKFFESLEDFLNQNNNFNEIQSDLIKSKIIEIEKKLQNEDERYFFYNIMTQAPISMVIDRISVMKLEQLIEEFYNLYEKNNLKS